MPVIEAGAVAVKQYAWFHAMAGSGQRITRDGRCYDVRDGTGDQLYKPNKSRIRADHYTALDATWSVSLRKSGNFFMTGYRRGNKANCGRDATGWKLFARSATRCAARGDSWREILRIYYGPGLAFVGDSGPGSAPTSDPDLTLTAPAINRDRPNGLDSRPNSFDNRPDRLHRHAAAVDGRGSRGDRGRSGHGGQRSPGFRQLSGADHLALRLADHLGGHAPSIDRQRQVGRKQPSALRCSTRWK